MGKIIKVRLTEYHPFDPNLSAKGKSMEGGPTDQKGKPLYSLEDYLEGKATYVSLSRDFRGDPPGSAAEFKIYGYRVEIPALAKKYGKTTIEFRLVDTGGHFFTNTAHECEVKKAKKKHIKCALKVVEIAGYEPIDVCRRAKPSEDDTISGMLTTMTLIGKP